MIDLIYLEKINVEEWNLKIPESEKYPRNWEVTKDLNIELSDGRIIKIPQGTIWDGASIPKWLWWLFQPIDEGALGDLIHDELWKNKEQEFEHFDFNIYKSRKFADSERVKWRNAHAPNKKIKTKVTNFVIRLIGGFFYSRQLNIPE